MQITINDVEKLKTLSALEFSDAEQQEILKDLGDILDMVNQLQNAKILSDDVYNPSHKLSELREDTPRASYPQEEILQNAPKARRGCFNVPLVVE